MIYKMHNHTIDYEMGIAAVCDDRKLKVTAVLCDFYSEIVAKNRRYTEGSRVGNISPIGTGHYLASKIMN